MFVGNFAGEGHVEVRRDVSLHAVELNGLEASDKALYSEELPLSDILDCRSLARASRCPARNEISTIRDLEHIAYSELVELVGPGSSCASWGR